MFTIAAGRRRPVSALRSWLALFSLVAWAAVGCGNDTATQDAAGADASEGPDSGSIDGASEGSDAVSRVDIGGSDAQALHCPGGPLCPCAGDGECDNGFCLDAPMGKVCAALCESSGCPSNFSCAKVNSSTGDIVSLCVARWGFLCEPCTTSKQCDSALGVSGMACVDYGNGLGSFCGAPCGQDSDCPAEFVCSAATTAEGKPAKMCTKPNSPTGEATCGCDERAAKAGLSTQCTAKSDIGTCTGYRVCSAAGLGACTAPKATTETCDNVDNDCNGITDDGLCDDKNPCTDDSCIGASKSCQNSNNTVVCSDGSACSDKDICAGGKCAGVAVDCDDKNVCTSDVCDNQKGCVHNGISGACNDGDDCTVGDACKDGACGAGKPKDCDDGNQCTQDGCDVATGKCAPKIVDGAPCSDGNACTTPDACSGDVCKGGPVNCDDKNPCTDDTCDPGKGCANKPNTLACDDANACTKADTCDGKGGCVGAPLDASVTCNDNNPCTSDVCDQATGCVNPPQAGPCEDSNPCTNGDQCTSGKCKAGQNICGCEQDVDCLAKDDGNPCNGTWYCNKAKPPYVCEVDPKTVVVCDASKDNVCGTNTCDKGSGVCGMVSAADGKACNADDSVCTQNDACKGGICTKGAALPCDDGNPCTDDVCDPKGGCQNVANTSPCTDGNGCTVGDVCAATLCVPGKLTVCNDGSVCTIDSCIPATGLCKYDGAPFEASTCDADGSKCTVDDKCVSGKCTVGTIILPCSDSNPCTDESCDPAQGCVKTNNSKPCDYDNDPCTPFDTCKTGNCAPGPKKDCDDKNACTIDNCDSKSGQCVNDPKPSEGANCEDGDQCTTKDTCKSGKCTAGVPVNCDDANMCTDDSCVPATGCSNKVQADGTACNDGNACTIKDICVAAKCGGIKLDCDDKNACTDDICGVSGCEHKNVADTTACGTGQWCVVGACKTKGCGDGYTDTASLEQCDDGNNSACDGCEACKTRGILLLDGKSFASAAVTPPLLQTYKGELGLDRTMTVEAWVRPDSLSVDTAIASKAQVGPPAMVAWTLGVAATTGYPFFAHQGPEGGEAITGKVGLTLGKWSHVAAVVAGDLVRLYVNGQPAGGGTLTKLRADAPGVAVTLGKRYSDLDVGMFSGAIDAVRLSAAPLYGSAFVPVRTPDSNADTRALWLFDDPTPPMAGTLVSSDSSIGGNLVKLGAGANLGPDKCYGASPASAVCGDGQQDPGLETCDDKNTDACDGCVDCQVQRAFDASGTTTAVTAALGTWAADAFCPTCELTAEAWVRLDKDPGTPAEFVSSTCGYFSLMFNGGKFALARANMPLLFSAPIDIGKWYHVAAVVNWNTGGEARLYVDGVLQATSNLSVPALDATVSKEVFLIGGGGHTCVAQNQPPTPSFLFPGVIDEVRVSSGLRYTDNFQPVKRLRPDRQTRGLWHFDEAVGALTYADDSGAGVAVTPSKLSWTNDFCYGQAGAAVCGDGQPAKYEACDNGPTNGPPPKLCSGACTPLGAADCSMVSWTGSALFKGNIMVYTDAANKLSPWTVEGWVKIPAYPAAGVTGWIVGVADAASGCGQPTKQEWYVATNSDGTDASWLGGATMVASKSQKIWKTAAWQHFAIQYEGFGRGSLWVDGAQVRTFTTVSTGWGPSCPLMLGNSATGKSLGASLAGLRLSMKIRYGQPFLPKWVLPVDAATKWRFDFADPGVGATAVKDASGAYSLTYAAGSQTFAADGPQCK